MSQKRASSAAEVDALAYHHAEIGPSGLVTAIVSAICIPLSVVLLAASVWLMFCAFASAPGMLFTGHTMATGIILLLAAISLMAAAILIAVPIVMISRRQRW